MACWRALHTGHRARCWHCQCRSFFHSLHNFHPSCYVSGTMFHHFGLESNIKAGKKSSEYLVLSTWVSIGRIRLLHKAAYISYKYLERLEGPTKSRRHVTLKGLDGMSASKNRFQQRLHLLIICSSTVF